MMQYISLFVLLVDLSGALSQTAPTGNFFNCRRKGITCTDGICDTAMGTTCNCESSFTAILDYNCVADADEGTPCTDPSICQNGGECRRVGGTTDTCFCPQLYTGTTCELPRIELTCGPTAMTVTVRPHGSFTGAMYAKGQASDTNCVLAVSGTDYVKAFDYAPGAVTNCGVVQSDLEDTPGGTVIGTNYTLNVIVQYEINPDIVMGTDQELVATCSFPDSAIATGVIFESDATGNLDDGTGDGEGSLLVFDIYDSTGVSTLAAAQTVNVGEELFVTIILQTNPAYPGFLIDSCTAANGDDDTDLDYDSLDFVTSGGCPTDNQVVRGDHFQLTRGIQDTIPGEMVVIPLYAFMFVKGSSGNKNTLYFSCSVQLCDDAAVTAGTCDAPDPGTCTGDFTAGLGKRRRRAADGDMRVMGQALTVRFGNATLEEEFRESSGSEQTGVETDTAKCLKNPELQTVISVLGIFLLVLLIALIVVTFLFCRRSRHTQGKYVDDGHTMGSSTQTLNMHIPRPRV